MEEFGRDRLGVLLICIIWTTQWMYNRVINPNEVHTFSKLAAILRPLGSSYKLKKEKALRVPQNIDNYKDMMQM